MKNPSTRQKGDRGEAIALEYLISSGYTILETNWSAHKAEIDIIAKEGDTLIFIEVKTRTSPTAPERAVTLRKQQLIASAASQYQELIDHNWAIRFDIITVNYYSPQNFNLEHFKDAFFPGL
ncbi:MAG: YraN family protein [Saprospiraceae bacterium]|nr:YraN family protein [Saprospiraceae bacterium]